MLLSTPTARRRRTCALALTQLIPLSIAAAPAAADTAVTSPADATPLVSVTTTPSTFAASGTATTETTVNLVCARKQADGWAYSTISGGTGIGVSGGHWSAGVLQVPYGFSPCRLLALPGGVSAPAPEIDPLAKYTGPRLRYANALTFSLLGGTNADKLRDFSWDTAGLEGTARINSIGGSGIATTGLIGPEPSVGASVFYGANHVARFAPGSPTSGTGNGRVLGLQVDGTNAWTAGSWVEAGGGDIPFASYDNVPAASIVPSVASDGSLVMTEGEGVRRCSGAGTDPSQYPLGGQTCQNKLVDPGVKIDVATTLPPSGHVVKRVWTLTSTDGAAHDVDLVLDDFVRSTSGTSLRAFRIAGGAFQEHPTGDVVTGALPAAAPFSIAVRRSGGPDPDPVEGFGAITFGAVPTALRFTSNRQLTASYHLSIPPEGKRELTFSYATEGGLPALETDIAAAEAAIRGPVAGASNDVAGGGGQLAAELPGGNRLSPTPSPGPSPGGAPLAPTLARSGKSALSKHRLALGYAVTCPGTGAECSVSATLAGPTKRGKQGKVIGRLAVTIPAGTTRPLVLTAKASKTAIRRAKPTLSVRLGRAPLTPTTATIRWRL